MDIEQNIWGFTPEGEAVILYTITNSAGAQVRLSNIGAGIVSIVVPDREAVARVFSEVGRLLADDAVRSEMEKNIRALAVADSADRVADEILKVVKRSE